jgi:serine/threonine protein kinase
VSLALKPPDLASLSLALKIKAALHGGEPVKVTLEFITAMTGGFKKLVGTGSFGDVFEGSIGQGLDPDLDLDQAGLGVLYNFRTATKVCDAPHDNPHILKYVEREIEVLQEARHPNIMRLIAYHCPVQPIAGGRVCLVYEYVEGGDLSKGLLERTDELSYQTRIRIFCGIA